MAQSKNCRNTKDSTIRKTRSYVFTLNNYMQSEIANIVDGDSYEYVFQEETGANGTPHLQGGLYFKNQVPFSTVKKLIPRAHIESCKNWHATKNYCSKGESRTGAIYTNIANFVDKFKNRSLGSPKIIVEKNLSEKISEDLLKNPVTLEESSGWIDDKTAESWRLPDVEAVVNNDYGDAEWRKFRELVKSGVY